MQHGAEIVHVAGGLSGDPMGKCVADHTDAGVAAILLSDDERRRVSTVQEGSRPEVARSEVRIAIGIRGHLQHIPTAHVHREHSAVSKPEVPQLATAQSSCLGDVLSKQVRRSGRQLWRQAGPGRHLNIGSIGKLASVPLWTCHDTIRVVT